MAGKSADISGDLPDVRLADVQQELEPVRGMSVWARLRLSYSDMRHATRTLIDESPSEPRLLFFVLLSDVIFFLSYGVRLVVSPSAATAAVVPAEIGVALVGILLVRTTLMYLFAALVRIVCRAFGGAGSWKETRAGVFWGSLVAAPVGVVGAVIGGSFAQLESYIPVLGEPAFAMPPLFIGVVAFVYFLSAGVAEAHRFRRTSPLFIVFSLLAIAISIGVLVLAKSFAWKLM